MTDAGMIEAATIDSAGMESGHAREAGFGDFVELLKPRVMRLVVFAALAGMAAAPAATHPVLAFASLLCIAVGAGASGALNMWWDRDIDAQMARTRGRPIPQGRVEPEAALGLGIGLSILSVVMLAVVANPLAAGLLAFNPFDTTRDTPPDQAVRPRRGTATADRRQYRLDIYGT